MLRKARRKELNSEGYRKRGKKKEKKMQGTLSVSGKFDVLKEN